MKTAAAMPALALAAPAASRDVRVKDVSFALENVLFRTPLKFGGVVSDRCTLLNVTCVVEGRNGKPAQGFGSMPLGNVWSFPSHTLGYNQTLNAMKAMAGKFAPIAARYKEFGHSVDLGVALEPEFLKAAEAVAREQGLSEPIPKLCTLVTASPFDAAIHDAYGKLHGVNAYHTYGPDFMRHDLSHYLGPEYKGEYLSRYVNTEPKPSMPLYHLVGAVDPLADADITKRIGDGLPETLPEWIRFNGLTHLKIKLNGDNLQWDAGRVARVDQVTEETQRSRNVAEWVYSLDFNEKCPNVQYLIDFLNLVKERAPRAFDRIQYIEQPTARDLKANRQNVMHQASKLRPVVIDESLTDVESLLLAREMGYTGAALKACKGQSQALLMAAAARKHKMFLCVQDLTCPGASLIHSAGLAAHVHGVAAIEANARQFCPSANKPWEAKFPGIFVIKDGRMRTGVLNGPGLGAV
ncbi:MAG: hypothetical protein NTY38_15400 [Acidobacteria bacterium]|nr:hypothetical protein [Acidobacteriota bacterium]